MRSSSVLLLGIIVGLLLVSPEVGAQSKGHNATSLCAEFVIPNNYNCIEYQAVTADGFILGLQNMPCPSGPCKEGHSGPPVLLQHGLTAGGDNWVTNSPQESLAFILADAGFDVWIANTRAIQWSHGHKTLTPSDGAYWAWSYDELASYDLKAFTELVFNKTGGKKLSYIGHSLGTTILLAGLSSGRFNTTVLGYLNAAVMMAPFAFWTNITAPGLKASFLALSSPDVYTNGSAEFSNYLQSRAICGPPLINVNTTPCFEALTANDGPSTYINMSHLGQLAIYFPQSSSTYNINHLSQGLLTGKLAFYDKGIVDNEASYGQATPPNYDLTTYPATLPTQYWTGGMDTVADPIDLAAAFSLLPSSSREIHTLANYGHVDFALGYNAYKDVYPSIITFLKKHV